MAAVTFTAYLKDYMSSGLTKISQSGVSAFNKLNEGMSKISTKSHIVGNSINQLNTKIDDLRKTRDLSIDTRTIKKANQEIEKLEKDLNKLESKGRKQESGGGIGSLVGAVGGAMLAGVGLFGGIELGKAGLEEYQKSLQASTQVAASLKSTNFAAGLSFQQLKEEADKLQGTTLFDADSTQGMQSMLLTFTNIKGAIFNEAVPAIQDMAQKFGGGESGLQSAAIQVGKALQNPIEGVTALQRVGVRMTEQQKQQIKYFVETNQVAKAQSIILNELNTEFGGSAAAARKAAGPMGDWAMQMKDLKETIGGIAQSLITNLFPAFSGFLSGVKNSLNWLKEYSELAKVMAIGIGAMALSYGIYTLAAGGAASATWAWTTALLANPITWIIVVIGALVAALVYCWDKFEGFRRFVLGLWGTIKSVFNQIWETVKQVLGGIGNLLVGVFTLDLNKIKSGLKDLGKGLINASPIAIASTAVKGFKEGYNSKDAIKKEEKDSSFNPLSLLGNSGNNKQLANMTGNGSALSSGIGTVTADNAQSKNVTINITNLVKELTFNTSNVNESIDKIVDRVKQALLTAVNDANYAIEK